MRSTMIGNCLAIAGLAAGIALSFVSSAQAADDEVLGLLGNKIALVVSQGGEHRCHLDASYIEKLAKEAIQKRCALEIVPRNQTDSRYLVTLNWGLGRAVGVSGSSQVNLCFSPFVVQFGRNADARLIEEDAGDLRIYAEALFVSEAFVHQMTNQTRNFIYDRLPQRFAIYAKDLCGG